MNKALKIAISVSLAIAILAGLTCLALLPLYLSAYVSDMAALICAGIMFLVFVIGITRLIYKEFKDW